MNTDPFDAPTNRAAHLQLDLFKVQIAPCGRSSAPTCWLEHNPAAGCWTCLRCGCIAPITIKFHDLARAANAVSATENSREEMPAGGRSSGSSN
jgi:hypothetical protein